MKATTLEKEILNNLLELKEQNKVLQFIISLSKPFDNLEKKIDKYAVGMDKSDLAKMEQAIDEGCENIDTHEWS